VRFSPGAVRQLTVEADSNILPYVETEVREAHGDIRLAAADDKEVSFAHVDWKLSAFPEAVRPQLSCSLY
jgi:hypothetical protein